MEHCWGWGLENGDSFQRMNYLLFCYANYLPLTLLVSEVAISVAVATVPAATIVGERSGRAKSHRISAILLLFVLAFLLRCL